MKFPKNLGFVNWWTTHKPTLRTQCMAYDRGSTKIWYNNLYSIIEKKRYRRYPLASLQDHERRSSWNWGSNFRLIAKENGLSVLNIFYKKEWDIEESSKPVTSGSRIESQSLHSVSVGTFSNRILAFWLLMLGRCYLINQVMMRISNSAYKGYYGAKYVESVLWINHSNILCARCWVSLQAAFAFAQHLAWAFHHANVSVLPNVPSGLPWLPCPSC